MIEVPEIVVERVAASVGSVVTDNAATGVPLKTIEATGFATRRSVPPGTTLFDLSMDAVRRLDGDDLADLGGVVVASFTQPDRFPALSVRLASAIGLPPGVPAFDLHAACSAYPYSLYVAGRLAADTGRKVLLVDGDVQSSFTDQSDQATSPLFSDAATATIVSSDSSSSVLSHFAFLHRHSDALTCPAGGPISMDGFGVFSFVAAEVTPFLINFLAEAARSDSRKVDAFVPHQANMYMVRQLSRSLGLTDRLATSGEVFANPGSCSIPLTIAHAGVSGRTLLAGFGAGLSASAALVTVRDGAAVAPEKGDS